MYDKRTDIINAFVNEDIFFKKLEAKLFDDSKNLDPRPQPLFEEGIPERVKLIRQKESDEDKNGQWVKILTSGQILSRLPFSVAQLKEGNNSEKPKNEIRQLLHSLYRS